jgi:hypothetical protein
MINEADAAPRTLDAAKAEASRIWASTGLRLTWSFDPFPSMSLSRARDVGRSMRPRL